MQYQIKHKCGLAISYWVGLEKAEVVNSAGQVVYRGDWKMCERYVKERGAW